MENLIYIRGQVFIGILTLSLIISMALAVYYLIRLIRMGENKDNKINLNISYIKSVGLLALIIGVLDQLIGLHAIFTAIDEAGDITASIVLNALSKSMIPLIYGIGIFIFSYLAWLMLDIMLKSKMKRNKIV